MPNPRRFHCSTLRREIKLIHQELVDGCNECKSQYHMCVRHRDFLGDVITNPRKYIELTKLPDGKTVSKRLFDITNIEGGKGKVVEINGNQIMEL